MSIGPSRRLRAKFLGTSERGLLFLPQEIGVCQSSLARERTISRAAPISATDATHILSDDDVYVVVFDLNVIYSALNVEELNEKHRANRTVVLVSTNLTVQQCPWCPVVSLFPNMVQL
jgi:hypothetical protein